MPRLGPKTWTMPPARLSATEGPAAARRDPLSDPGYEQDGAAQERCRPGMQLHPCHLEQADPLPRLPRTGAQQ